MTAAARRARKAGSEGGYSLIETLAAVFILALASGVAVATLPPGADPRETDALAFADKLERAGEEAVLSGLMIGVDVDADGYGFRRRVEGDWARLDGSRVFAAQVWPEQASVAVAVAGDRRDARRFADVPDGPPSAPALRFDPTGAATPAEVLITYADIDYRVRLGTDGAVTVETGDES